MCDIRLSDYDPLIREVLASGGTLLLPKYAHTGVTFAAAVRPFAPDWRWKTDEA